MRIAFFSPLNPILSGISDYSEELLPALAQELGAESEITLVVDGYTPTNEKITAQFRVLQSNAYNPRDFDLALYQLGNSPAHAYIYQRALTEPGIVVLHELVLHHLVAWLTLNRGDRAGYIQAMRAAYGENGAQLAAREANGQDSLNRFDYPLSEHVARASRGVIAHSHYVGDAVRKTAPGIPVAILPQGMLDVPSISQNDARAQLHLPADAPLIGSFGIVGPTKRITVLLEAFRTLRAEIPNARLVLVGGASPNFDLDGLLNLLQLRDAVIVTRHVSLDEFHLYMAAMDVCVNLRYPTAGETSAAVLRMMAQGKAVVVSRAAWFAELPDDTAAKIDLDDNETGMLSAVLERLLADAPLRAAMGTNARHYIESSSTIRDSARAYADFLHAVHEGRAESRNYLTGTDNRRRTTGSTLPSPLTTYSFPLSPSPTTVRLPSPAVAGDLRDKVTETYVELGLEENDATLRDVAQALTELGLNE